MRGCSEAAWPGESVSSDSMRGAKLGQHFLNAQWVARDLVKSVGIHSGESIIEVGPGKGALTKELLAQGARVIAIEKDIELIPVLNETFKDEIIRHFLTAPHQPRAMALLIQKEVAERIVARGKKESILSLSVKAYGKPSIVAKVTTSCFNPPPRVDSAILLIENISRDFFDAIPEDAFFKVVKTGFASKRKMLAGNLKGIFEDAAGVLAACGIPEKARAEDLQLEHWKSLASKLR